MTATTPRVLDRRVIDADVIHPVLKKVIESHWPDVTLDSVHVPRVIPKRSGEIVIQYDLRYQRGFGESPTGPSTLFAQHFPDGEPSHPDQPRQTVWIEELKLRLWLFPGDPELDHLHLLCDPQQFHSKYDPELSNVGYSDMTTRTRAHVIGYRLGRRCVARVVWSNRLDSPSPRFPRSDIVIKMSRKRQAIALWTRWRQLEHEGFCHNSADGIGLPKSLFLHSDTGALFQDFVPEKSLHEVIGAPDFADHCERAGLALHKLHATRIPGLAEHTSGDELSQLRWLTEVTGVAFPMVAATLEMKYVDLEHSIPEDAAGIIRTSHRDFYDKQVLSGSTGTFLLDCDTLAMADPALDHSNFLAHLVWRQYQYPEHATSISHGIKRFINVYPFEYDSQHRASWWLNAALLRLACIYTWRPQWHSAGAALANAPSIKTHNLFA